MVDLPVKFSSTKTKEKNQILSTGSGGRDHMPVFATKPDSLLFHYISEDELEMLGRLRKDGLNEVFWVFLGGALGLISTVIKNICNSYIVKDKVPLELQGLIEIIVFGLCLGIVLTSGVVSYMKSSQSEDLVDKIRKRKKKREQ